MAKRTKKSALSSTKKKKEAARIVPRLPTSRFGPWVHAEPEIEPGPGILRNEWQRVQREIKRCFGSFPAEEAFSIVQLYYCVRGSVLSIHDLALNVEVDNILSDYPVAKPPKYFVTPFIQTHCRIRAALHVLAEDPASLDRNVQDALAANDLNNVFQFRLKPYFRFDWPRIPQIRFFHRAGVSALDACLTFCVNLHKVIMQWAQFSYDAKTGRPPQWAEQAPPDDQRMVVWYSKCMGNLRQTVFSRWTQGIEIAEECDTILTQLEEEYRKACAPLGVKSFYGYLQEKARRDTGSEYPPPPPNKNWTPPMSKIDMGRIMKMKHRGAFALLDENYGTWPASPMRWYVCTDGMPTNLPEKFEQYQRPRRRTKPKNSA